MRFCFDLSLCCYRDGLASSTMLASPFKFLAISLASSIAKSSGAMYENGTHAKPHLPGSVCVGDRFQATLARPPPSRLPLGLFHVQASCRTRRPNASIFGPGINREDRPLPHLRRRCYRLCPYVHGLLSPRPLPTPAYYNPFVVLGIRSGSYAKRSPLVVLFGDPSVDVYRAQKLKGRKKRNPNRAVPRRCFLSSVRHASRC